MPVSLPKRSTRLRLRTERVWSQVLSQIVPNILPWSAIAALCRNPCSNLPAFILTNGLEAKDIVATAAKMDETTKDDLTLDVADDILQLLLERSALLPEDLIRLLPFENLAEMVSGAELYRLLFESDTLFTAEKTVGALITLQAMLEHGALDDAEGDTAFQILNAIGGQEFDQLLAAEHGEMAIMAKDVLHRMRDASSANPGSSRFLAMAFFKRYSFTILSQALPLPALMRPIRMWADRMGWLDETAAPLPTSDLEFTPDAEKAALSARPPQTPEPAPEAPSKAPPSRPAASAPPLFLFGDDPPKDPVKR